MSKEVGFVHNEMKDIKMRVGTGQLLLCVLKKSSISCHQLVHSILRMRKNTQTILSRVIFKYTSQKQKNEPFGPVRLFSRFLFI